jgi:hypothetical protein
LLAAVWAIAPVIAVSPPATGQTADGQTELVAPASPSAAAVAQYRRALAEYQAAQAAYAATAEAYWNSVAQKRHLRNAKRASHEQISLDDYVLSQPPAYDGPPKPRDPSKPTEAPPPRPYVPVVGDFFAAARQEFKFVPRRPDSEGEFKRAYARVALAAGLNAGQIVRIYSFEAGGNGSYDVQAGLEHDKQGRAITTALGYNQLLATNSVEVVAESGDRFVKSLLARAAALSGADKAALESKIAIVRKMIAVARNVPDDWNEHEALGKTQKGLGIHALNLDVDVGPFLQAQKLMDSVNFARRKGYSAPLTAAELEMMNLTGDGNGFDMVGYRDNPVAQRNNVVARLIAATEARMDREIKQPGAMELAAALQQ